jgi:protease IV
MNKKTAETSGYGRRWAVAIFVVMAVGFLSMMTAAIIGLFSGESRSLEIGNVAVIPVHGLIQADTDNGLFADPAASASDIIAMIDDADEDTSIKAILFDINSPGGYPVATDEIGQRIKSLQKPNAALIRDVGASGGYWIASACDHVIANRMSVTGSIGVYGSYLQFSRLIEEYNVSYERFVSGRYKDLGSPWKDLSADDRQVMQSSVDLIGQYFIEEVAHNRNLTKTQVENLATGQIYLGGQAKELGLIDALGSQSEAVKYIELRIGEEARLVHYSARTGFWDMFSTAMSRQSYSIGQGIGSQLLEQPAKGPMI